MQRCESEIEKEKLKYVIVEIFENLISKENIVHAWPVWVFQGLDSHYDIEPRKKTIK